MVQPSVAITGVTGNMGGRVARRMEAEGMGMRLLARDPSRVPLIANSEVARASYDDGNSVRDALSGIQTVFMVSGSEEPDRVEHHKTFIDAASHAGVTQLVYTSFYGAARDAVFTLARDHWETEEYVKSSGLAWTFLRNNIYLDFVPHLVGEDGVIRGPAGDGRVAAVSQADIADVAAKVLLAPAEHIAQTYQLTGPEAITLAEAAEITSHITGQRISYHPETIEEAYASRAKYRAPQWQVDAWVSTYMAIASGELERVTHDVERIAGHRPLSLAQLIRLSQP